MRIKFLLSVFLVSLPILVLANPVHETAHKMEGQAQLPFAKKFKAVLGLSSVEAISTQNIQRLKTEMEKRRDLNQYLAQAEKIAGKTDLSLQLAHSTNLENAIHILQDCQIKSLDARVREGSQKPEDKLSAVSSAIHDGKVGEQDVVFLALESGNYRKGAFYGDIHFIFDKETLLNQEDVYFSPFAFGHGQARGNNRKSNDPQTSIENDEDVKTRIPLYRSFIFKGFKAYLQLLKLSAVEVLWEREYFKKHPEIRKQLIHTDLVSVEKGCTVFGQNFPASSETDIYDYEDLARCFSEDSDDHKSPGSSEDSTIYYPHEEGVFKYLSAYRRFPDQVDQTYPTLLTKGAWNWEVKVPEALPLNLLKKISFLNIIPTYKTYKKPNLETGKEELTSGYEDVSTDNLQKAIEKYAEHSERKYKKSIHDGQVEYEFLASNDVQNITTPTANP